MKVGGIPADRLPDAPRASVPEVVLRWFAGRGWALRPHQLEMLEAAAAGQHALLVAATGSGKTLAGFLPALVAAAERRPGRTIYVSPLKALAADIARNLERPVREMGLALRVEARTGDTAGETKARQRRDPPDILLTTPESLSLLLTYPDAAPILEGVETLIIDEVHAFAATKRGDLLALAAARLQALNPAMRRVALSATIADPEAMAGWLAPGGDAAAVRLVRGAGAVPPEIGILVPDGRIPWSGHNGRHAAADVMRLIEAHRQTIVFVNTRAVAELVFRDLWAANDRGLAIGIHHGSLAREAREKTEAALAEGRLRAVVATASLDLGIDWGDVDLVIQMGAPKGASRLLQRVGRANHRLEEPSKAVIVPGNRFEYLEALAAWEAVRDGDLDGEPMRPGGLDVLAQHLMGVACAAPFEPDAMLEEVRSAAPFAWVDAAMFGRVIGLVESGGYALRAYDRFRRLKRLPDGRLAVAHPRLARQHRLNAGVIVEAPAMAVRLGRGRAFGTVEEWFGAQLRIGDSFIFAGQTLEVTGFSGTDILTRLSRGSPLVPLYVGGRMPLSTNLADRVRAMLADPGTWDRMPGEVRDWMAMQQARSVLPPADRLLVETFPRDGREHAVIYGFEGRNAHQSLGMLLTQRMEKAGLGPLGFVATDYALAVWSLREMADPASLLSPDVAGEELARWIEATPFLRRAFRDVAIVSGLVERAQPGNVRSGKAMMVSTDLIFDVLRRHEPDHLLLEAAWAEARARLTDIARLEALLRRAESHLLLKRLPRVSPLAVPVLLEAGRESVHAGAEEELVAELIR